MGSVLGVRLLPIPGVFQPPSDARLLAQCLRRERLGPATSVLDLCAGSGYLALTAAATGARAVAVDVSRLATIAVRANARLNGIAVTALHGDLFGPVRGRRFDVIVSNPPYLPGPDAPPTHGLARAWEAGPRGRLFLDRICAQAADHLRPGGVLLLVHSAVCSVAETVARLERHRFDVHVAASQRGPFGPLLGARIDWLAREGLLSDGDTEEVAVIRAQLAVPTRGGLFGPTRSTRLAG